MRTHTSSSQASLAVKSFDVCIYSVRFFDELMLIYPFYTVMFVDHGMSSIQVSLPMAGSCAASVVFEVPSIALADKYFREKVLFLGQLLRAEGFGIWTSFPKFLGFLAGFVLWGIKGAPWSGTFEALFFDELKRVGAAGVYVKVAVGLGAWRCWWSWFPRSPIPRCSMQEATGCCCSAAWLWY